MIRYKQELFMVPMAVICNKCGKEIRQQNFIEWNEKFCWSDIAGFGSIFGDGNSLSCDLCQRCLKELLGAYIRKGDNTYPENKTRKK